MHLILMRHGEAEASSGLDHLRPLTVNGRQQAQAVATELLYSASPDLVISSPLVRAQQTLAIVTANMAPAKNSQYAHLTSDLLAPEACAQKAIDWLCDLQLAHHNRCVLVVCHMNIIGYMDGLLRGDTPHAFALSEARCYQQKVIASGLSSLAQTWLPPIH